MKAVLPCLLVVAGGCAGDPRKMEVRVLMDGLRTDANIVALTVEQQELTASAGDVVDDELVAECRDWQPTQEDVRFFFGHADVVPGEVLTASYYSWPCSYGGSFQIAGEVYRYGINGGAYGYVRDGHLVRPVFFGCKQACTSVFEHDPYGARATDPGR